MESKLNGIRSYPNSKIAPISVKDTDVNKDLLEIIRNVRVSFTDLASYLGICNSTANKYLRKMHLNPKQREQFITAIEESVKARHGYTYRVPEYIRFIPEPANREKFSNVQVKPESKIQVVDCQEELSGLVEEAKALISMGQDLLAKTNLIVNKLNTLGGHAYVQ